MVSSFNTNVLERSNVTISGAGPQAIVFLHGLGADQSQWRLIAPCYEDRYQVVLFDLIGAGKSDSRAYSPHTTHSTLQGHADDLLDVLRSLALYDIVFVGHSIAAMIGVLAAIREPERFAKLVMISPSPRFLNDNGYAGGFEQSDINELLAAMESDYNGWSNAMAPVLIGPGNRPELVLEMSNSFVHTNPEIAQHFARVTFLSDNRELLPFLLTPSLIIQSAHDVVAPLSVGLYLQQQLVDSELVVVETTGHCPHLTASEQTVSTIDHFLQRGW
ncbi:alpha/beta fold hydrolase [uncultured Hymenobacter sp.]|uniref:alpha/beta fold hydrolase n=1 Tax=uncultured Hymenobacter sp. TaxID=170016 RepID=UPI0035CB4BB6